MHVPSLLRALGWNRRILTYEDFEFLCTQLGVYVLSLPVEIEGLYTHYRERPVIVLSQALTGHRRTFIAWHEMAHFLCHHPGIARFDVTSISKAERQANAIAACALIPQRLIRTMEFNAIAEQLNLPHDLVLQRADVWRNYRM